MLQTFNQLQLCFRKSGLQIGNLKVNDTYKGMWSLTGESNKETGHCDLQVAAKSTFGFVLSTFKRIHSEDETDRFEVKE